MIVSDIFTELKYFLNIPYNRTDDPLHPDWILFIDLRNVLRRIVLESGDKITRGSVRLIAEQREYPLPSDFLKMAFVQHYYNNIWQPPLNFVPLPQFRTSLNTTYTSYTPRYYTIEPGTSRPVVYTGTVTTADSSTPPVLYDSSANFGVTLTGDEIKPGYRVFNVTDDSYGYVSYIGVTNVNFSGTDDGGTSTTLVDSTQDFTSNGAQGTPVSVGDIVLSGTSWGVVSSVDTTTLTVTRIYGDLSTFNGESYVVGKGQEIHLSSSGLVIDTEEGLMHGAEGDWDEDDEYQVESIYETLDTLLIKPPLADSDDVGTESLRIYYYGISVPTQLYHDIPMNEAYRDAIVQGMLERARMREEGGTLLGYAQALEQARIDRMQENLGDLGNTYIRPTRTRRNIVYTDVSNL